MRRHQRKAVGLIRRQYQSNDPMRWVNIAIIMDVDRKMTPRERRIFINRATRVFKELGMNVKKMLETFGEIITSVAESVVMIVDALRANPDRYKLDLTGKMTIDSPGLAIPPLCMGGIYDAELLTTPTIPPHIVGVDVDK